MRLNLLRQSKLFTGKETNMGFYVSGTGGDDFPIVAEGLHLGVAVGVYDIGHHKNPFAKEDETDPKKLYRHQLIITWELPSERMTIDGEDKPRHISTNRLTTTIGDNSNLGKLLVSWRGRSFTPEEMAKFNLKAILGVSCQVQVIHAKGKNDKTYANVLTVVPAPKGVKLEPESPLNYFCFEDETSIPETTPGWVQKAIMDSLEWKKESQAADDPTNEPPIYQPPIDEEPGEQMPF